MRDIEARGRGLAVMTLGSRIKNRAFESRLVQIGTRHAH